jgi:hypothetical protein
MRLSSHGFQALFATGVLIVAVPAHSALTVFTDRAAFEAVTHGLQTITFEDIVEDNSSRQFPDPAGLSVAGVKVRTFGTLPLGSGFVSVYGGALAQQSPATDTGTGAILVWGSADPGPASLDVVLPPGVTAFATDLWTVEPYVSAIKAVVNSGESTENFDIYTSDRPDPSFFGVVSDGNTILLVRFRDTVSYAGLILDNVAIGSAGPDPDPVPELGTGGLICPALIGIAVAGAKRAARVAPWRGSSSYGSNSNRA